MTISTFIIKNALRNKRRAALSTLSVAVSLFLLVTLRVALRELTIPPEDIGAASRIIVRNKISLGSSLPARQRAILEKIPGVEAVTPFTYFGGLYRNDPNTFFAQFAVEPKTFMFIMGEAKVPADQVENFYKDQRACIVGKLTADKYKIKVGDRMPFTGTFWPCDLELTVAGIYQGTPDDRNVFFHHKYFDEAMGNIGQVGTWWIKARSIEDISPLITKIDQAFANTSAEVRAETERAFQMSFISMWGNIQLFIGAICTVVVFALVLVAASTMSMAVRERFRELAILKALGFRRRELFVFILAESFGLASLGALLGVGGAWWLFMRALNIPAVTKGILITFEVTPNIIGEASLVAALLGIIASVAPSISVSRMSVVEGLKTLD
jgi:putative ABC transport system permease protein